MSQTYGEIREDSNIDVGQPLFTKNPLKNLVVVISLSDKRLKVVRDMQSYSTGEDPFDAYWRTLMCNYLKSSPIMGPFEDFASLAEFREK